MSKRLITVGDSFTYGDELTDRNQAWPQKLGDMLEYQVVNLGLPSASNDKIMRRTIDQLIKETNNDLVVVGWTSLGRMEFADEFGYYDVWPGYQGNLFKKDTMSWRSEIVEYISRYHSSEAMHLKFLQQVITLQSFFKQKNINYLMLNTLQNEYYKKKHFDGRIRYFEEVDKSRYLGFDQSGMIEWADECPKGPGGHFLDEGHLIVAETIYKYLKENNWV